VFGLVEAIMKGSHLLIGIADPVTPRIYTSETERKDPAWWVAQEQLCLGGGGDFPDEHRNGAAERLRGTSTSMLMYEALGINDAVLKAMADEVNFYDSHVGCPRTHLASLIKMAFVNFPGQDDVLFLWAAKLIGSVYDMKTKGLQPPRNELPFADFASKLMNLKSSFEEAEAREGLLKLIGRESNSPSSLIFSVRTIYEALWRTSQGTTLRDKIRNIGDDVMRMIAILYKDQINYHAFRDQADSQDFEGWFWIPVNCGSGRIERMKAAFAETDNPQAHNALRSYGAMLSIVKNTKGNATILGNQKLAGERGIMRAMDEGMQNFIAMNRWCDLPLGAEKSVTWDILKCRGKSPVEKRWYLADQDWLAGYNGTWYHKSEITGLPLRKNEKRVSLQENAEAAFDPNRVDAWKRNNHVPDNSWFRPLASLDEMLQPKGLDLDRAFRK
jgi:hypothetical protein